MSDEAIRFLIQQKISFINSVAYVCMWWWVSSTIFCGSILGGVWSKQDKLKDRVLVGWLGTILFIFFSSIIAFGITAIIYISRGQAEIDALASGLKIEGGFFHTELSIFRWAMVFGSSSFVLARLAWIFLWNRLRKNAHKPGKSKRHGA